MAATLSWGILGTGNIAGQFAVGVNGSERGVLGAVGSRQMESAKKFAATHKVARAHGSYESLFADPNVDAIYLSLPNSMHYEWTLKALRAGKHVLCEKPLATNVAQAAEMFDVARQQGRVLMEAFMYRSHPLTLAVQKAVAEGKIGTLKVIRTSFLYLTTRPIANVRFDASLAGGSLMDIGCYCLSYSRLLAGGEPTGIQGYGHLHGSGVDDYAAGAMAFPGGIVATFSCGMTVPADNTAFIHGSTGYIEIPVPWKPPANDALYTIVDAAGQRQVHAVSAKKSLYALEADDFAGTLLDGTPQRVSQADSMGNQKCLDELRRQIGLPF